MSDPAPSAVAATETPETDALERELFPKKAGRADYSSTTKTILFFARALERRLAEVTKERDAALARLSEVEKEQDEAIDAEQARWQQRIDAIISRAGIEVDGSGCDSGDPLDLTAAEIELAFGKTKEIADSLRSRLASAEAERDALRLAFSEASHNAGPAFVAHEDLAKARADLASAEANAERLREALEGWGMLYNTPPIVVGDEWIEAFKPILEKTIAALASTPAVQNVRELRAENARLIESWNFMRRVIASLVEEVGGEMRVHHSTMMLIPLQPEIITWSENAERKMVIRVAKELAVRSDIDAARAEGRAE